MQGPIMLHKSFTYETIRLYNKIFPHVDIILSTWQDEDENTLRELEKLSVKVILNEKPSNHGHSNINLQIISTSIGVKYAYDNKYLLSAS
jgi:cystathionine beta-lyase/cystathionine gamma-synthase